jgi:hypothetical protein
LTDTDVSAHVLEAISQSTFIQTILDEMKGANYREFHPTCQGILAAYESCCEKFTVDVAQLKPFASFAPCREYKGLKFNFVLDCLSRLLKQASLTLSMMTDCSLLLSMLFAQEEISDELLECVLEIANQALDLAQAQNGGDYENDPHLLSFLVDNGLVSFPTFFAKKKTLKNKGASEKVVEAIQAIMRSDEKYVAMISALNLFPINNSLAHERILEATL